MKHLFGIFRFSTCLLLILFLSYGGHLACSPLLAMSSISSEPTTWTNGDINQFYLDFAHTQKTFNDIKLDVGTYTWSVETIKRNNQPGKVNFDISVLFSEGDEEMKIDEQFSPGNIKTGTITIEDFKSQSSGSPSGYGKIKIHIGRADHNTNVNYKITLTKTGALNNVAIGKNSSKRPGTNLNLNGGDCNYTDLGEKTGNVIGNTVGKFTSDKKACKNTADVVVRKTDGSARTTILVYASSKNTSTGELIGSDEFPNGDTNGTKTISLTGVKNKFITVELKNRSATNQFKYTLNITQ